MCQDVGHGGVGVVILLWRLKGSSGGVDEPRRYYGEHVELLAGVGRRVRAGCEVVSEKTMSPVIGCETDAT